MKTILSLLLIVALSAPEAMSAGRRRAAGTPTPAKPDAAATPDAAAALPDIEKACKLKDVFPEPNPKSSSSPEVIDLKKPIEITDDKLKELRFKNHCELSPTQNVEHCDETLAKVLKFVKDGNTSLENLQKNMCDGIQKKIDACKGQTESQKCMVEILNPITAEFKRLSEKLKENEKVLKIDRLGHHTLALKILQKGHGASPVGTPVIVGPGVAAAAFMAKPNGEAVTGASLTRGENQTKSCIAKVGVGSPSPDDPKKFCSHITAASDAAFYAAQLGDTAKKLEIAGAKFKDGADKIAGNIDKGNSTGPGGDPAGNKKGGILDSMGGLDGLMKMATLGMMGAGLYCSVSGECSQKPSAVTAADPNAGLAATAPTPASTNPGPETSNTGDNQKIVNNNPVATQPEVSTKVDPLSGSEGFSSTGSGFSSDKDQALAPFSGALERAPASAGSPGGGGGGGGAGSSDSGAPHEPAADAQRTSSFDNGIGSGSGGGGLAHSGGFSLGDQNSASPTDSALKDILNGDMPPGDAGLASILDGDPGATAGAEEGIDMQGAESLFLRVRDTHVRCVKRGCVGHEVGEHI